MKRDFVMRQGQRQIMVMQVILVAALILQIILCCDVPLIIDEDFFFDVNEFEQTKLFWRGQGFDNVTWAFIPTGSVEIYPFPFTSFSLGIVRLSNSGRTLIIEKTPLKAYGVFMSVAKCTLTGKTDSINITLMVHDCFPPTSTISGTSNASVELGEPAILRCFVEFQCLDGLYVSVNWLWNGTNADTEKGVQVSTNISDGGTQYASILRIQEVKEGHFRLPFICAVDIPFEPTKEKEVFLIKISETELVEKSQLASLIPGVTIPIALIVIIIVASFIFWPNIKWKKMQYEYKRGCRNRTEDRQRKYDVFLYHNDDGSQEAAEILQFLSRNGYNVLSDITPGQAYSSVRAMIEDSASAIIIATSDEMLPSVLTETTEEIRIPILVILTKEEQSLNSPIVNTVKLSYPYDTFTCYSLRKRRFYMKLRVNLPFPRASSDVDVSSDHLDGSSIALLENVSTEKNTVTCRDCENNIEEPNDVV